MLLMRQTKKENEMNYVKLCREDVVNAEIALKQAKAHLEKRREAWQESLKEVKHAEDQLKLRRRELFSAIESAR